MTVSRCILSCILAGLASGVVAPALWFLVLQFSPAESHGSAAGLLLSVYVGVIGPAVLCAVVFGVLAGVPILFGLRAIGRNTFFFAALAGATVAPLIFIALGFPVVGAMPVLAFLSTMGALVGGLASRLARPNNSFKPEPLRGSA